MAGGRPTKLTPELQKAICEGLAKGHYAERVCAIVGINDSTFYDWCKRGEKEESGIYSEFASAVKKASAQAEVDLLAIVWNAAADSWQAAMTILERRYPARWARRDPDMAELRELKDKLTELKKLSDEEVEQKVKQLSAKDVSDG